MLELFGFAWVTITFTCCVAAISTRRSVLRWLKARADRKRLDDTVEIVRRPLRRLATYAALVVLAVPAGVYAGGGALPGPLSAAFTGGTVANAVVLTGDNASGTGTLRIRPSDRDTQLVLCEATNNASPEVCSFHQHYNPSATGAASFFSTNLYLDPAGAAQRHNTGFGSGYFQTFASSTLASNGVYWGVYGTAGTIAAYDSYLATGASAATHIHGAAGTVTQDIRGPILNGGSAACNGIGAGSLCLNDDATVLYSAAGTNTLHLGSTAANGNGQIWTYAQATGTAGQATNLFATGSMASPTLVGGVGYYGSTSAAGVAYQDRMTIQGVAKTIVAARSNDANATTKVWVTLDDATLAPDEQLAIFGEGTVAFPQTQTVTCADNGGGTNQAQTLDPQAHTITIINNDATGCDVTMQETSAQLGAVIVVCVDPASTATNVNFADVANVFNGAAPALGQGDCFTARYFDAANDLWLQTGASNN